MRVLIVDDDPWFRDHIASTLGPDALTAREPREGLRLAAELQPDLIILDQWYKNNRRTGVEVVPAFRAAARDAVIVVVSIDGDDEDAAAALDQGADGYGEKGTDEDLSEAIRVARVNAIRRRRVAAVRDRGLACGVTGAGGERPRRPPIRLH